MSRPTPVQPPPYDDPRAMAHMQRASAFPPPQHYYERPEQLRSSGPQLPPIHAMPPTRSGFDASGHPVQLPPMQVPHHTSLSPGRAPSRSIPVSQLLTSPPSPPRSQQPVAVNPGRPTYQAPASVYSNSPSELRTPPQRLPHMSHNRLEQAPVLHRHPYPQQQQQQHQQQQAAQYQYQQDACGQTAASSEYNASHHYSPSMSVYSSPRSYPQSQASPRPPIAPASQTVSAPKPKPKPQPPPHNYNLTIRQQPAAARACGFGERDRRVIDPPPILEMKITDRNGLPEQDLNGMLALHCTLINSDGGDDETEQAPAVPDMPSTRRLMGTLVASPYQAKDENGIAGTFFVFPDLSCRSPGRYRLKFKLIRVDGTNMTCVTTHGSVVSEVFSVYTAKDFPGMRASSSLLKALRRQGLNVGVKKGSEARKGKAKTNKSHDHSASSDEEGSDDSESGSGSTSPKAKSSSKKGKKRRRD